MKNTISKNQQQKINKRLGEMPRIYRQVYEKALAGKSRSAAVKAFCLECVCWQKNEIIFCTSCACPLFAVRPFVKREKGSKKIKK
jgi:hypothetical protein